MRAVMIWRLPLRMVFTTVGGLLTGALMVLTAPNFLAPMFAAWDAMFPVMVPVESNVVQREPDAVLLHIVAKKTKGEECRLVRVYGYGLDAEGRHSLATVRRPDGSEQAGITHGPGVHDFGVWRIKPTDSDTVRVQVKAEHNCLGRVIPSTMAEAPL